MGWYHIYTNMYIYIHISSYLPGNWGHPLLFCFFEGLEGLSQCSLPNSSPAWKLMIMDMQALCVYIRVFSIYKYVYKHIDFLDTWRKSRISEVAKKGWGLVHFTNFRQKVELLMIEIGFVSWKFAAKKRLPLDSVVLATQLWGPNTLVRNTNSREVFLTNWSVKTIESHIERWFLEQQVVT